eukprot:272075_1
MYLNDALCAICLLLIANVYVIFTIVQMKEDTAGKTEMWILAYVAMIIPSFVSIYGIIFTTRSHSNQGGLSILIAILHLTFLICIVMAKIITIFYEQFSIAKGISKILDLNDEAIWIIFMIWTVMTTYFVIQIILNNIQKISMQIHSSLTLCIFNYITYLSIFFMAFFVFDMSPAPLNASNEIKYQYNTINKFCGGCGVFMNLMIVKQILLIKKPKHKKKKLKKT